MESLKLGDMAILRTNRKDDQEPFWQDETDWLCRPNSWPQMIQRLARLHRTLSGIGSAMHISRTPVPSHSSAISTPMLTNSYYPLHRLKRKFLELVRSKLDMGNDYIENDLLGPTIQEITDARPLAMVLLQDVFNHAALIAATVTAGTQGDRCIS